MKFELLSLLFLYVTQIKSESLNISCVTPGGEPGEFVYIQDCPVLLKAFSNPIKGTEDALIKFALRDNMLTYVCCTRAWNYTIYDRKLSDRRYCGYQHVDDYISDRNTTSIDEFPWLAAIMGVDKNTKVRRIVCQGSLINNRYVITSARCFVFEWFTPTESVLVLLGEHHVKTADDCVEHPNLGTVECSRTEEYDVEETVLHPLLTPEFNDIALLRLNRTVTYTEYIRPICLPIEGTKFAKPGDILYTTGWGRLTLTGKETAVVKKKVQTMLLSYDECVKRETVVLTIIDLLHICTIDIRNNTEFTCQGDSGAPIMHSRRNQWHLEGIVTTGGLCNENKLIQHTRVSSFLDWIRQNMRP